METPMTPGSPQEFRLVFVMYFLFKLATLAVAAAAIYLGYRLFILGVSGEASLVLESPGFGGQLLNAAPGLFFAIGGIGALIMIVRKGIKIDTSSKGYDRGEMVLRVNRKL